MEKFIKWRPFGESFDRYFVAALLGLLLALSAPGMMPGGFILAWIIPGMMIMSWQAAKSVKQAFKLGFMMGFFYFALYCFWFLSIVPLAWMGFSDVGGWAVAIAGWLLLAFEGGLLLGGLAIVSRYLIQWLNPIKNKLIPEDRVIVVLRSSLATLLISLAWVGGFALLNLSPLTLSWPLLEYSQAGFLLMRELAGYIGGSGLALVMIMFSVLPPLLMINLVPFITPIEKKQPLKSFQLNFLMLFAVPIISLLAVLLFIYYRTAPMASSAKLPIPVAVIQANFPIEVVRTSALDPGRIERAYFMPLLNARFPKGTLVALPEEGVVTGWVSVQHPGRNAQLARLAEIVHIKGYYASVGVTAYDEKTNTLNNAIALISPDSYPDFPLALENNITSPPPLPGAGRGPSRQEAFYSERFVHHPIFSGRANRGLLVAPVDGPRPAPGRGVKSKASDKESSVAFPRSSSLRDEPRPAPGRDGGLVVEAGEGFQHGTAVQFYAKRRLVPFGESTPYGWEPFLTKALAAFQVNYSTGFVAGTRGNLLTAGKARMGGLICFEVIDSMPVVGGFASGYQRSGANLLINASNLGWFHQNPLLEAQFLAMAQMRAAETHLPLVIASNSGHSAIISARGDLLRMTDLSPATLSKTQIIFYNKE